MEFSPLISDVTPSDQSGVHHDCHGFMPVEQLWSRFGHHRKWPFFFAEV
jgi:hypothetical protein